MASLTSEPPTTTFTLLFTYASRKFTLAITSPPSGITAADVKGMLHEQHLPAIPSSWFRIMKRGKEISDNDPLLEFAKDAKRTKLKLMFSNSEFSTLSVLERERRLDGGAPPQMMSGGGESKSDLAAAQAKPGKAEMPPQPPPPPQFQPETEPSSWIISVTVKHAKNKHILYFTEEATANVGGLRQRLSIVTGVAPKRQRLVVTGRVIGMGANAKNVDETETLLSLSKGKKKLKIKLLFDAKHHHAVASTSTLLDVRERLIELEKAVRGMHRKMKHNFFDANQMIVEGRSFGAEIYDLERSVERLPSAEAAKLEDCTTRVETLKSLSREIDKMMGK